MQFKLPTGSYKWYYGLAVAVVILCFAGGLLWQTTRQTEPAAGTNAPLVRIAPVRSVDMAATYAYPGEVRGRYESELAFRVSGKIINRSVNLGDEVYAGEVLMQLDPQDVEQLVTANAAQVAAAEAQLELAASNLRRYRQLYVEAAVSRAQLDQYQSAYDVAQATVRQASAQYAQGANQLDYSRLAANAAGVVSRISAETGQVVSAGQTVLTLVQAGEQEVEINVPEHRLEELRQADHCAVTFWALPTVRLDGRVREIAPAASAVTRTYKVRIALINPPPAVKLGMTANVTVAAAGGQATAVTIPASALYQTGDTPGVWVVKGDAVSLRPVTVGVCGNDTVQVLAGLQPGEAIVTAGVHKLREGQQVRPAIGGQL